MTGTPVVLALLGDSIAWEQGASREDERLGPRLAAGVTAATGRPVRLLVHAVPGARSADLAAQLPAARRDPPDVAVVVVGANDLTHLVPPESAARDLGGAVAALRRAGARVVVAPAPDLSVVPHVPAGLRGLVAAGSRALAAAQRAAAEAAGAVVAEGVTSEAFGRDPGLFSADRFHPSSAGYAVIAAALLPAVLAAAAAGGDGAGVSG